MRHFFAPFFACAFALTFTLTLTLTLANLTAAHAADLTGSWEGHYAYPPAEGGSAPPVVFSASLRQSDEKLEGEITEPNTFAAADKSVRELKAKVAGTVTKQSVRFVKTYDGTGGQSHSVRYRGKQTGDKVQGTWTVDTLSGTFEMERVKTKK